MNRPFAFEFAGVLAICLATAIAAVADDSPVDIGQSGRKKSEYKESEHKEPVRQKSGHKNGRIWDEAQEHWAFQVPQKSIVPPDGDSTWPRTNIDRLILRRLADHGMQPSPDADRPTIARRLYFDLVGLPPTYEQIQHFVDDSSPTAYADLVDQLLASPHFGERWARHWLDLARFGDTKGYVFMEERDYPHAYKYRDWVIGALNRDMPFNDFLKKQLAADLLIQGDDKSDLAALGYVTLGRRFINNKHDIIDDRIDVVFRGMMAITASCARCHDHKYDPISLSDYYGLYGIFANSPEQQDEELPLRLAEADKPHDVRMLLRGNPGNPGDVVQRGFLSFFAPDAPPIRQGSGRLELAQSIASHQNPLTARVFVNRAWDHLMGAPLVSTPSDFGLRSARPVQQDVLDHLAVTFMEDGPWSVKRLIRRIVLSSAYRQRSDVSVSSLEADPENMFWGRGNSRRLDFEAMRDSLLAVCGRLDRTVGGPSERIEAWPPTDRRTLYAYIDRQNLPGLFRTFDFASPDLHCPRRPQTTVPQQGLYLMNNEFVLRAAEEVAASVQAAPAANERVSQLYRLVFGRDPSGEELQWAAAFIAGDDAQERPTLPEHSWQFGFGHVSDHGDVSFQPLPHFTGTVWQGGPERPDPTLGWVFLEAAGGHPGGDGQHAAIRRWTAPRDGTATVRGRLHHPSDKGDGVRARIVSSRAGLLGTWVAQNQRTNVAAGPIQVCQGDTLDLIVDCRSNESHDSFKWPATIELTDSSGRPAETYSTEDGFHGPLPEPLGVWGRYAHTLLMTNEFMFLD